jgi:hypothetical protein
MDKPLVLRSAATIAVLATAAIAVLLLTSDSGEEPDATSISADWTTIRVNEYGYELSYPPGWSAFDRGKRCDETFCTHSLEIEKGDEASVVMIVNFQGGLCEGSEFTKSLVLMAGRNATRYDCPGFTIRSFGPGDSITYVFDGVQGEPSYLILGQASGDLAPVEGIMGTLTFLD